MTDVCSNENPAVFETVKLDIKCAFYPVEHLRDTFPEQATEYPSPLTRRKWPKNKSFVNFGERVMTTHVINGHPHNRHTPTAQFLRAGPSETNYWDANEVRAAIVTSGGLCPGLNTVIRELVMALTYTYGVSQIYGVQNGYRGFWAYPLKKLTKSDVSTIHQWGGTALGTSRGGFDAGKICDAVAANRLNQLYLIGGDGTHRGAKALLEELKRRNMRVAVVAIPKTVDNDIPIIDQSFGFNTAVERAVHPINCAHTEAQAAPSGVGLVKLMGRQSGFIAMNASLASRDVNLCLIPEASWTLKNVCEFLEERLGNRDHAVIVVAEGATCPEMHEQCDTNEFDESGNPILPDVGGFLKKNIDKYFKSKKIPITIKYIEPTYMVRSTPANAVDSLYCANLAFNAVHGAFAGYTNFTVGMVDRQYVWLPISAVACLPPRRVDIHGPEYARLCLATGQPKLSDDEEKALE